MLKKERGITLIALVITIIVLLILAGVTIAMVVGDNGILTRAREAKFKEEISGYLEKLEIYKANKSIGNYLNEQSDVETLLADKGSLYCDGKILEGQTIKNIIDDFDEKYNDKLLVLKGKMWITQVATEQEIDWAKDLGVEEVPLDIEISEGKVSLKSTDKNLENLKSENGTITIPSFVTSINSGVFNGVDATTVIIPPTVERIEANAFSNNKTITSIIFDDIENSKCTYIGTSAFANTNITEIVLPDSVTELGNATFRYCYNLTKANIPKSLKVIPGYLFSSSKIKSIEIPEGVTTLNQACFRSCTLLETINIPSTVTSLGAEIFYNDPSLNNVELETSNYVFNEDKTILMDKDEKTVYEIFTNKFTNKTINIPEGVNKILTRCFTKTNENNLILKIPSSVNNIGYSAFSTDTDIDGQFEVNINNSKYASTDNKKGIYEKENGKLIRMFTGTDSSITIDENIKVIGEECFNSTIVTSITLPDNLQVLENYSLFNLSKLQTVILPNNISSISDGGCVFYPNVELKWKNSANEGTNYKIDTFKNQQGKSLIKKDDNTLIWVSYNSSGNISASDFPSGIKKIATCCFRNKNYNLLELPDSIEELLGNPFAESNVKNLYIPSSVNKISQLNGPGLKYICIDKPSNSISGSPWGAPSGDRSIVWNDSSILGGKNLKDWFNSL